MKPKVFIDGEHGTTGLQIRSRLAQRSDLALLSIPEAERRNRDVRAAMLSEADIAILCLPDDASREAVAMLEGKNSTRVIDTSTAHRVHPDWAYGFAELESAQRERIAGARLVANPGCYTTTSILAMVPLLEAGAIEPESIVIDAKSGMTGAGRAAKEEMLFSEVSEGMHAYGVGQHRHMSELDQEFSLAAKRPVTPTFTPHLIPMNRGIYATHYVKGDGKTTAEQIHKVLADYYKNEAFVQVLEFGRVPQSRHVRGTNFVHLGVAADRAANRTIVISTLDNLVKGASGQAIQNMNLMLGLAG